MNGFLINDDKRLSKNAYELKQSNNNSTLTIFCRKTTMNDAYLHSIGLQSGWVAPCQKSAEKMEGMVALTKTSLNGKNVIVWTAAPRCRDYSAIFAFGEIRKPYGLIIPKQTNMDLGSSLLNHVDF